MRMFNLTFVVFLTGMIFGSCNEKPAKKAIPLVQRTTRESVFSFKEPLNGQTFTVGDVVNLSLAISDTITVDSIQVFFHGKQIGVYSSIESISVPTTGNKPGKAGIRIYLYYNNGKSDIDSQQIELVSDIIPTNYRYRIENTYPHDVGAYTQGLEFFDGWLYEGTGNRNQSTIRKVRLEDGEVVQIRNNASSIFGEGITLFDGKIYQLTYTSQVCFVYDMNTFEEKQKYYYQNKEGWGLTNNGKELIMSDGSHVIYFIDPNMFTVLRQVEVYDNEGIVDSLNELEYIQGKIFANRYFTDEIVIIDPETGKLEGRIDLKGILPIKDRKVSTDVLNGIAWDKASNRIFVTGKYWPKMFEIRITPIN
ncbi:glutaminyl-peptide cyclotransferase [Bacteroidota bacterium]